MPTYDWAVSLLRAFAFAGAGLVFGSFLTVVVHRVPRKESIVAPRSACPSCGVDIAPRDNIPLLSYLLLRGRCRHCGERISPEYPLIEAGTAALFVAASAAFSSVGLAALVAPFLGVMLAAAVIDVRHMIIPNRLMYPSLVLFALGLVAMALGGWAQVDLVGAVLGFLVYGGGLLVIAVPFPTGMGMGDVKLAGLIGLVLGALGWRYVAVAVMVSVLAGGLAGLALLAAGRGRKHPVPFGPFLGGGAILSALFAAAIADWYWSLLV